MSGDPMRDETRRIYSTLCREHGSQHVRLPAYATRTERARLRDAVRRSELEEIAYVLRQTGSIAATMAETGADYALVRAVQGNAA